MFPYYHFCIKVLPDRCEGLGTRVNRFPEAYTWESIASELNEGALAPVGVFDDEWRLQSSSFSCANFIFLTMFILSISLRSFILILVWRISSCVFSSITASTLASFQTTVVTRLKILPLVMPLYQFWDISKQGPRDLCHFSLCQRWTGWVSLEVIARLKYNSNSDLDGCSW